jgi:hypothetical protein
MDDGAGCNPGYGSAFYPLAGEVRTAYTVITWR